LRGSGGRPGPSGITGKRDVTFDWQWSDAGSTLRCRLDGAQWKTCVGPLRLENLDPGAHVFRVRAVDPQSNVDPTPATRRFRIKP
jgi:large repetitive protein